MRLLRTVAWIAGVTIFVIVIIRAGFIAVLLPYAVLNLFRESGYPWWIQVPAAIALIAGFAYLWKSGGLERLGRRP